MSYSCVARDLCESFSLYCSLCMSANNARWTSTSPVFLSLSLSLDSEGATLCSFVGFRARTFEVGDSGQHWAALWASLHAGLVLGGWARGLDKSFTPRQSWQERALGANLWHVHSLVEGALQIWDQHAMNGHCLCHCLKAACRSGPACSRRLPRGISSLDCNVANMQVSAMWDVGVVQM